MLSNKRRNVVDFSFLQLFIVFNFFKSYNVIKQRFAASFYRETFRIALYFRTNIKYSQHISTRLSVGIHLTLNFDCRAFSLFETVTGSRIKTIAAILWYPLQIHNNFYNRLVIPNKHRISVLIRFKISFLQQFVKYLPM